MPLLPPQGDGKIVSPISTVCAKFIDTQKSASLSMGVVIVSYLVFNITYSSLPIVLLKFYVPYIYFYVFLHNRIIVIFYK